MMRKYLLLLALIVLPFAPAHAAAPPASTTPSAPAPSWNGQPDLISFGVAYDDFDKDERNDPRTQSVDFRLEYRWGTSLVSAHNGDWFNFGIHPIVGAEVTTRSQLYGFGGFAFDLLFWKHIVFTESEVVGLWSSGNAKPLGSFIEFRSQAELGYRFDNDMRITGQISHISNAGLTNRNPGEEIAGAYLHVPVAMIFGN